VAQAVRQLAYLHVETCETLTLAVVYLCPQAVGSPLQLDVGDLMPVLFCCRVVCVMLLVRSIAAQPP
jgi:hypothetical protein